MKETIKLDSDKVKSLSLDLERKDDEVSDLKEKLSDSKKQIQQVQIEVKSDLIFIYATDTIIVGP